ncbi:hypothetical protein [Streptodolium elevatio]|uniref:Secreted protein n=1 Tax=Streptodolium elevatio TaxID=3157996 RepID=A0ABV3DI59_9ACTN
MATTTSAGTQVGTSPGASPDPGNRASTPPVRTAGGSTPQADSPRTRLQRLRHGGSTPPGRLRVAGVVLCALVVVFGALAAWQVNERAQAADRLVSHSGPLSHDAAEIYRSLADADTTAAAGFLLGAEEPRALRERYEGDLAKASELLVQSAARTSGSSETQRTIADLTRELARYSGLVEVARTNNRQGLPLGGAYLRYASTLMQDTVLRNAQSLVDSEERRLDADYDAAESFPWAAAGAAVAGLGALGWYQVVLFRRTNRVFNLGLAGATAALFASSLWLVVGATGAASSLADSRTRGAEPLSALNAARFDALQAHAAENLNLVARGSSDTYNVRWDAEVDSLTRPKPEGDTPRGSLIVAVERAPDSVSGQLAAAQEKFAAWQDRHNVAAEKERKERDYDAALKATVTADGTGSADSAFNEMDDLLAAAAAAERREFDNAARDVDGELRLLALGVLLLTVPAAIGVVRGINRRLAEYR